MQARWLTHLILNNTNLPSKNEMIEETMKDQVKNNLRKVLSNSYF